MDENGPIDSGIVSNPMLWPQTEWKMKVQNRHLIMTIITISMMYYMKHIIMLLQNVEVKTGRKYSLYMELQEMEPLLSYN